MEDYKWLEGTHHRDFDDQLVYKTIRVYTMRFQRADYIVGDRLVLLKNNRYSGKGDCTGIHIREIERYTRAYMQDVNTFLHDKHSLLVTESTDSISDDTTTSVSVVLTDDVMDTLLPAYIAKDELCTYMVDNCMTVETSGHQEIKLPATHKMALRSPYRDKWIEAERSEIASLESKGVFQPMVLPTGKSYIDTKWVYVVKYKNGEIARFKVRLVAKGYEQIAGIDFDQTFSPVARMASLRLVLALSAIYRLEVHQMDVETAFLNADLEEEVYIRPPEGITIPEGCNCLCLKKALYGLKQAPRAWNKDINLKLQGMGFTQLQSEPRLYFYYKDSDICIIS